MNEDPLHVLGKETENVSRQGAVPGHRKHSIMSQNLKQAIGLCMLSLWAGCTACGPSAQSRSEEARDNVSPLLQLLIREYEYGLGTDYYKIRDAQLSNQDVEAAKAYIVTHPDRRAFLVLLALRNGRRAAYDAIAPATRAKVVSSVLGAGVVMDAWGDLRKPGWKVNDNHTLGTLSEMALNETGQAAIPELQVLLDSNAYVTYVSSSRSTIAFLSSWQVKDYAYKYIVILKGWPEVYRDTRGDRGIEK